MLNYDMTSERETIIQSIENRFQLVLMFSIFFPTLVSVFFNIGDSAAFELRKQVLVWFSLVGLYLLSYILFQGIKHYNDISTLWLRRIKILLLIALALYIFPVIFFATTNPQTTLSSLGWINAGLFYVSLCGLLIVAVLVLFTCSGILGWSIGGIKLKRKHPK